MLEAVICISEFDESPREAIHSVLSNAKYFSAVHLEKYGYDSNEQLYPTFSNDLKSLADLGKPVTWHNTLDLTRVRTDALIYITPDLVLRDGALEQLIASMDNNQGQSLWAVTSELHLTKTRHWYSYFAYGFLLVIHFMDAVRWAFHLTRYHRTFDLRAQALTRTYKDQVSLVRPRWWVYYFFSRVTGTIRGGVGARQVPDQTGWAYLWRTINTHAHLGIALWWPLVFVVYYWLFAFPWWNRYVPLPSSHGLNYWIGLLRRDPYHSISIFTQLLHLLGVLVVANTTIKMPSFCNLLIIAFPFYLTLFPVILIIGRFYMTSRAIERV